MQLKQMTPRVVQSLPPITKGGRCFTRQTRPSLLSLHFEGALLEPRQPVSGGLGAGPFHCPSYWPAYPTAHPGLLVVADTPGHT